MNISNKYKKIEEDIKKEENKEEKIGEKRKVKVKRINGEAPMKRRDC